MLDEQDAIVTLEHAAQYQKLPVEVLDYLVDQFSMEPETLIQNHFNIIRHQISRGDVEQPINLLRKLRLPPMIDPEKLLGLNNLGIIQTFLFVTYLQPSVFDLPTERWSRECLCVEILAG